MARKTRQQEPFVPGRTLRFADKVFEEHPSPPIQPITADDPCCRNNDMGDDDPLEPEDD